MLLRRRIIQDEPAITGETVTIVRPRSQSMLFAGFGLVTMVALAVIGVFVWNSTSSPATDTTPIVVNSYPTTGRAERFEHAQPNATNPPTTIIVNQPPIIVQSPPASVPQDTKTYIVPGSPPAQAPGPTTDSTANSNGTTFEPSKTKSDDDNPK